MEKLLFLYTCDLTMHSGGTTGTEKAFSYFSQKFDVITLCTYQHPSKFSIMWNSFFGYLKASLFQYFRIKNIIQREKIQIIYFDDSVTGKIIEKVKEKYPSIFLIVNFHNDEIKYYHSLYRAQGYIYKTLYLSSIKNQHKAVQYSDLKIFITEEEKCSISKLDSDYLIVPALLKDDYSVTENTAEDRYFLFFGSAFFANIEAAEYIIEKIAPFTNYKIVIAGNGMSSRLFVKKEIPKNVEVYGFVENINSLFNNAIAFLCPIFSGAGMKVKIIEALMRGKSIISTTFAAIGYEKDVTVFTICDTQQEFLSAINDRKYLLFNENARSLFLKKYNLEKIFEYYDPIIKKYESFKNNKLKK